MHTTIILTCEHAGNDIPAKYNYLFKGSEEVLYTHKAIDFGALQLAKHLAAKLKLAVYYTSISRLLIEANRSPENEELFSEYTQPLSSEDKKHILDTYYFPHRQQVEEALGKEVAVGNKVVHVAVHSFTPAMDGDVRKADIGILFDPKRKSEKLFADILRSELLLQEPDLKVLYNSPYPGTSDGLPEHLRKVFPDKCYSGFELEVNQKFYLNGNVELWEKQIAVITAAFTKATFQVSKSS